MMMRTPVVSDEQIEALTTLLKIDFTRGVAKILCSQESPVLQTIEVLELTETLMAVNQPLLISKAMMLFTKSRNSHLALDPERYSILVSLFDTKLGVSDFPGIEEDIIEDTLTPLRAHIETLRGIFESAGYLDSSAVKSGIPGLDAKPKTSGMN
jgi:hypothetical protein